MRRAKGLVVVFVPGFLGGATVELAGVDRVGCRPTAGDAERGTLPRVLAVLESEYARMRERPSDAQLEVLRNLLSVLVLRLAGDGVRESGGETFTRFQAAVEAGFSRTRQVEDYAAELGYSVRTLTRATQAAVGFGAKRFVDDRVLLEAKRLLVHTHQPVVSVAQQLGFPEATVFTKFFRQRTGRTPGEFRACGF
ncbi:helix-turn-helix transcriptional regulator [Amycolatopsis sp. NPDC004368]